jgi:hypothetical protein
VAWQLGRSSATFAKVLCCGSSGYAARLGMNSSESMLSDVILVSGSKWSSCAAAHRFSSATHEQQEENGRTNKPTSPQMARLGYRCDYGGGRIGNVCNNVGSYLCGRGKWREKSIQKGRV